MNTGIGQSKYFILQPFSPCLIWVRTPPPPEMTCGFLQKKKTMWFIGVEVEQETCAPPPKKNPGSAPEIIISISC